MSTDEVWPSDALGPLSTNRFGKPGTTIEPNDVMPSPQCCSSEHAVLAADELGVGLARRLEPGREHERVDVAVARAAVGHERRALDGREGGGLERRRAGASAG